MRRSSSSSSAYTLPMGWFEWIAEGGAIGSELSPFEGDTAAQAGFWVLNGGNPIGCAPVPPGRARRHHASRLRRTGGVVSVCRRRPFTFHRCHVPRKGQSAETV